MREGHTRQAAARRGSSGEAGIRGTFSRHPLRTLLAPSSHHPRLKGAKKQSETRGETEGLPAGSRAGSAPKGTVHRPFRHRDEQARQQGHIAGRGETREGRGHGKWQTCDAGAGRGGKEEEDVAQDNRAGKKKCRGSGRWPNPLPVDSSTTWARKGTCKAATGVRTHGTQRRLCGRRGPRARRATWPHDG